VTRRRGCGDCGMDVAWTSRQPEKTMKVSLSGDSRETLGDRGERPTRRPRSSREEEERGEAEEEGAETPRRETPRSRRRELEADEGALDSPPTSRAPWMPPARR